MDRSERQVGEASFPQLPSSRRQWLQGMGMGVGGIALQWMLAGEDAGAAPPVLKEKPHRDLLPRPTHFAPKAKAMISLFQHGGP